MKRFVLNCAVLFLFSVVAVQAAPFAYIADAGFNGITVIDLATRKRQARIPIPNEEPFYVAVTPDGKRAYVTDYGYEGGIWVIDTLTMQPVEPRISVDSGPGRTVISPDGKYAYTVYPTLNEVTSMPTATNSPTKITLGVNPCDVVFTPDSARAYVVNRDATVSVINTATNAVANTISIGTTNYYDCGGMAITPDGSRLYVTRYDSDKVSIIDTASNTLVGSPITVGGRPARIRVAPDNSRVYFLSADGASLAVVSRTTNSLLLTIPIGVYPSEMTIKPDGSEIYVADSDDNAVWVIKTTDYSSSRLAGFCAPYDITIGPIATTDQLFADSLGC